MAGKTLSDEKVKRAAALVTNVVEPEVGKLVEKLNETLAKHGIKAGCSIEWFFDELENDKGKRS